MSTMTFTPSAYSVLKRRKSKRESKILLSVEVQVFYCSQVLMFLKCMMYSGAR